MLSTQIGNELAAPKIDLRDAILGEKGAMIDQREAAGRCAFDEVRALHDFMLGETCRCCSHAM